MNKFKEQRFINKVLNPYLIPELIDIIGDYVIHQPYVKKGQDYIVPAILFEQCNFRHDCISSSRCAICKYANILFPTTGGFLHFECPICPDRIHSFYNVDVDETLIHGFTFIHTGKQTIKIHLDHTTLYMDPPKSVLNKIGEYRVHKIVYKRGYDGEKAILKRQALLKKFRNIFLRIL